MKLGLPLWSVEDTIVAIASPPGGAMRGILRVSGPNVIACLLRCFHTSPETDLVGARHAAVFSGSLQLPPPVGQLEGDLYLWPDERSYTKQPAAEFHTLGSPPLLDAAVEALCAAGARLAEPGEFTLRAFLAGRLDLTQAEAVLGVIDARSCRELNVALSQLAGGLATPLHALRNALLELLADLEASLDFADEDIEFISSDKLQRRLADASSQVSRIRSQLSTRVEGDDAPRVVFVGWPNVGKSSLFNALAGESAAIVSPVPGTTRDYLAKRADVDGLEVLLIDTAGAGELGSDSEALAAAAQEMMLKQAAQADLQILCIDSTRALNPWEKTQLATSGDVPRLSTLTKTDGPRAPDLPVTEVATSSRATSGLSQLHRAIRERIESLPDREYVVVASTATRCRESLRTAANALERSRELAAKQLGEELVAAETRLALEELGTMVGTVYTDDILDRIFSRFCIGK